MNLNHIFSLIAFAIGALCFGVFMTTLKPPLHHSETAVDSIYGRGMQNAIFALALQDILAVKRAIPAAARHQPRGPRKRPFSARNFGNDSLFWVGR
jgi:hypothetical protein